MKKENKIISYLYKRSGSREADPVGVIVCTGKIGRYLEGEYLRGVRGREIRI